MQVTEHGQAVWTVLANTFLTALGRMEGTMVVTSYMIACASHRYVPVRA